MRGGGLRGWRTVATLHKMRRSSSARDSLVGAQLERACVSSVCRVTADSDIWRSLLQVASVIRHKTVHQQRVCDRVLDAGRSYADAQSPPAGIDRRNASSSSMISSQQYNLPIIDLGGELPPRLRLRDLILGGDFFNDDGER